MSLPGRVQHLGAARRRWGARADQVAELYGIGDPDFTSEPLLPPTWLDLERCNRGGRVLRRYGLLTGSVLRCYALPLSYLSPAGIVPLVATASLVTEAGPRLYRTALYVFGTQADGAMAAGGEGWALSARIRSVHQAVRQRLLAEGWDETVGAPIPQPDLASTALLFGPLTVEGLRRLGARISTAEADAVTHLSRAMAAGQGVVPELQADTYAEALELMALLTAMNGPPTAQGAALMQALLQVPYALAQSPFDRAVAPGLRSIYDALAAELLGPGPAAALGVKRNRWIATPLKWSLRTVPHHPVFLGLQDRSVRWVTNRGFERIRS